MAENSTKFDHQKSSSPSLKQENHPRNNDNDTLLPTHSLKDVQENESVNSNTRSLSPKARQLKHKKTMLHGMDLGHEVEDAASDELKDIVHSHAHETTVEDNGREKLKRHRVEVAGRVWIPDIWGQEDLLKDWIDCSVFEASLASSGIMSARAALVGERKRSNSGSLRVGNRC